MKVLSLAHECVREASKVKEGDFFYAGPSPMKFNL